MRRLALACLLVLATSPLSAQEAMPAAEPPARPALTDPVGQRLAEALPGRMLRRMQGSPDRVLRDAGGLIYGYGSDGGIDRGGVDRAVSIARADARGRFLGQILRADLNADGALSGDEAAAIDATAGVRDRGRMRLALRAADADGDGTATAAELGAQATQVAARTFSDDDAGDLAVFLTLDLDADGRVTLDEVARALAAVAQPQAE